MKRRYVRSTSGVRSPKKPSQVKKQGINLKKEFEAFAAKRPVNIPGAQARASKAYDHINHLFTEGEKTQLSIAWSHATGPSNEGRAEHDRVCARIRERLFPR